MVFVVYFLVQSPEDALSYAVLHSLANAIVNVSDGAYLESPTQLNQRIDNITGATLSVNAMKKLSKMALYLHDHVTTEQ